MWIYLAGMRDNGGAVGDTGSLTGDWRVVRRRQAGDVTGTELRLFVLLSSLHEKIRTARRPCVSVARKN